LDGSSAARLQQPGGYAALFTRKPVHNFWLYLGSVVIKALAVRPDAQRG
jgi:hypothetical protein